MQLLVLRIIESVQGESYTYDTLATYTLQLFCPGFLGL